MSTYPDPTPIQLKTWTVWLKAHSEKVRAYSIEYTRTHVVFKTWQGVTYQAYRAEDVKEILLVP